MDERTEHTPLPHSRQRAAAGDPSHAYRRGIPHITQEPIDDVEFEYVTRERYETLEQAPSRRRHMGTATSDPDYLSSEAGENVPGLSGTGSLPPLRDLHYERYLETPKPGKSIFTSRRERKQRRAHLIILIIALLALVLAIVWFFFLR